MKKEGERKEEKGNEGRESDNKESDRREGKMACKRKAGIEKVVERIG